MQSPSPVVLEMESEEEWEEFALAVVEDFKPVGPVDRELAERAACLMWRLRRAPIAEVGEIRTSFGSSRFFFLALREVRARFAGKDEAGPLTEAEQLSAERIVESLATPDAAGSERICRHEAHLSRQLYAVLAELRRRREDRRTRGNLWLEVKDRETEDEEPG